MFKETTQERFAKAYVSGSVVRWLSNDRVPFDDMLIEFFEAGLIAEDTLEASKEVRIEETGAFLTAYAENRRNRGYSAEEMFEMRAAFGEGETVVDVFTGRTIQL